MKRIVLQFKDVVHEFSHGVDHFGVSRSAFSAFAASSRGTLKAAAFTVGLAAKTADHHLIYDKASGALYYDADGVGGAAQVQIAVLLGKPTIDAADFVLI